jgi:hypothetical protein
MHENYENQPTEGAGNSSGQEKPRSQSLQLLEELVARWIAGQDDSDLREQVVKVTEAAKANSNLSSALRFIKEAVLTRDFLLLQEENDRLLYEQSSRRDLTISEGLQLYKLSIKELQLIHRENRTEKNQARQGKK